MRGHAVKPFALSRVFVAGCLTSSVGEDGWHWRLGEVVGDDELTVVGPWPLREPGQERTRSAAIKSMARIAGLRGSLLWALVLVLMDDR